jgi:hypothetical protein
VAAAPVMSRHDSIDPLQQDDISLGLNLNTLKGFENIEKKQ